MLVRVFGDVANLLGALFTQQIPSVQYTAMYFVASDVVTILQYVWYAYFSPRRSHSGLAPECTYIDENSNSNNDDDECTPLLNDSKQPTSTDHSSVAKSSASIHSTESDFLLTQQQPQHRSHSHTSTLSIPILNSGLLLSVMLAVSLASSTTTTSPADSEPLCIVTPSLGPVAQNVGIAMSWASGLLYFCSRIPQILTNHRLKTVQGLSISLFLLTISANVSISVFFNFYLCILLPC
jgi:hypothetical protein